MRDFENFYSESAQALIESPFMEHIDSASKLNFFSNTVAFLTKLLPMSKIDYREFYRGYLLNNIILQYTQDTLSIINETKLDTCAIDTLKRLKSTPHVLTTFHFGPHYLIPLALHKHNVPFAAVISKAGYTRNAEKFTTLFYDYTGTKLELIDAEKPNSLLTMMRAVKSGKTLLMLLDINRGLSTDKESLLPVNLLNSKFNIRKGAAFISHVCNVPILAGAAHIDEESNPIIRFSKAHTPCKDKANREIFIQNAMQGIFSEFGELIARYPSQWEAWSYLKYDLELKVEKNVGKLENDFLKPLPQEVAVNTGSVEFDISKYVLFNFEENGVYLLDIANSTYNSFRIPREWLPLLLDTLCNPVAITDTNKILIGFLLSKKVLCLI